MSRELSITRDVELSAEAMYRAWTEPELMVQWFVPRPWQLKNVVIEPRVGGSFITTMCGPDGDEATHPGLILEAEPGRRLVFTNLFSSAWEPQPPEEDGCSSFMMVGIVSFEPLGPGRTRYTATVRHWTEEDTRKHEAMGFHEGWNKALDQLIEVMSGC